MSIFPWAIAVLTSTIYFLAGRKYWWTWLLSIAKSSIALFYFSSTKQWGFVPFDVFLIAMSIRNLYLWRKDDRKV